MLAKKSFLILFSLSLIFLISSICGTAEATDNSSPASRRYGTQISKAYIITAAGGSSSQGLTLDNPYWKMTLDAAGYSDYLDWWDSPRPHIFGEMLSGEWAAAIYYDDINTAPIDPCDPNGPRQAMWLTDKFIFPDWDTNSNFEIYQDPNAWDDPCNPVDGNDTGYSVIRNDQVEVRIDYEVVDLGEQDVNGEGGSPLAFRDSNGLPVSVYSERYVLLQTYTITNIDQNNVNDLEFYQMLVVFSPFGSNSVYETCLLDDPLEDYSPHNPVHTTGNFRHDITQWNSPMNWIGLSSTVEPNIEPNSFDNGFYEGPLGSGTDWRIGQRTLNGEPNSSGRGVAGATGWYLGTLEPNDSVSITVALMLGAGPIQPGPLGLSKVDDVNEGGCVGPGVKITYTIDYNYLVESNWPDIEDVNIIDYLPTQVDFNLASDGGQYNEANHTVTWYIGTLSPGESGSVTLEVDIKECVQPCIIIENKCEIRSGIKLYNKAYEYTSVGCPTLTKQDIDPGGSCVWPGNYITYSIQYDANGYNDTNVTITDELPNDVNFISAPDGNYNPSTHKVIWDINELLCNDSDILELVVQVNPNAVQLGTITNNCRMIGDCIDINTCEYTCLKWWPPICCCPIYVDVNATGANNGCSWEDAFTNLQDALVAVEYCNCNEILVAAGTYKPDEGITVEPNDREATFNLTDNLAIYGGFPAGGGPWESRDPTDPNNETILSGDLLGNDGPCDPYDETRYDNSYHVVTASDTNETAVLDGFTITGGNGSGYGGGMYNESASPAVKDCTFSGNSAYQGGGMYNDGNAIITGCTFSGNVTTHDGGATGGGMYNSGRAIVTSCTFVGNSAFIGGGIASDGNATITNCIFSRNWVDISGGGMSNSFDSSPTITNCTFSGNSAGNGGGMYNESGSPTIVNCTFSGNKAYGGYYHYGGGIYNDSGSPKITNCIFWGNRAIDGNEVYNDSSYGDPNFSYCDIRDCNGSGPNWDPNLGTDGGGNIDTDPCFVELGYWGDVNDPNIHVEPNDPNAMWFDGNYRLLSDSPCIDAGDNNSVTRDYADLDNDGDTFGLTPLDLDAFPRFIDDLCTTDTGNGTPPIVDMGAYEFLRSDINRSGSVNFADFALFASRWFQSGCGECCGADLTCDGKVEWADLREFVRWWLAGTKD